jgi:hypothetical protein
MRTTILCKLHDCESHNSDLYCTSSDILIDTNGNCQTYRQKCDHIIGTIPAWHRPGDASSDILIFQSNIDVEDADVTLEDIEELFDYCPKCGTKL